MPGSARRIVILVMVVALMVVASAFQPWATPAAAGPEAEPNQSLAEANAITLGETITGEVASGLDRDFFSFPVNDGDRVRIEGRMTDRSSSLVNVVQFEMYGPGDTRARNTSGIGFATEATGIIASGTGTAHVEVNIDFNASAEYEFVVTTSPAADPYEVNNEYANATPLVPGQDYDAFAWFGDLDHYAYAATAGDELTFRLDNNAQQGVRRVFLNTECAVVACAELAEDTGLGVNGPFVFEGGSDTLTVNVVTGGTVYATVGGPFGFGERVALVDGDPYTLALSGPEPDAPSPSPSPSPTATADPSPPPPDPSPSPTATAAPAPTPPDPSPSPDAPSSPDSSPDPSPTDDPASPSVVSDDEEELPAAGVPAGLLALGGATLLTSGLLLRRRRG